MKVYEGLLHDGEAKIFVTQNNKRSELRIEPSLRVWNHSPSGFNWGYGGSGPAQTSLALLLDALGDQERAVNLHQSFKFRVVADWPSDSNWTITDEEIKNTCTELEMIRERIR